MNEEFLDESCAEKVTINYSKKMAGKKKESEKRARRGRKHAHKRIREYDYDAFNDVDLKRYF